MLFVALCLGTPEGSTGNGSGFKASQKTGQQLKVSSDRLEERIEIGFAQYIFIREESRSMYKCLLIIIFA